MDAFGHSESGCSWTAALNAAAVVWLLVFFFDDFEMDPRFDV